MSNKAKQIIIFIITIMASAMVGVSLGLNYDIFELSDLVPTLVFTVIGTVVLFFTHLIAHELGHLIGGLCGGYKFKSFAIGSLMIEKQNGKIKVYFNKPDTYGGLCQMIPSKTDNIERSFKRHISGGLIASSIFAIIAFLGLILPFFVYVNKYVFVAYCLAFPISLYILLSNYIIKNVGNYMTDGGFLQMLKDSSPEGKATLFVLIAQSLMSNGERPKTIDEEMYINLPKLQENSPLYFIFYSNLLPIYIDKGEVDKAIKITDEAYANMQNCVEIYRELILADIFFVKTVYQNNLEEGAVIYNQIASMLERTSEISSKRCQATYEIYYNHNIERAKILFEEAKELFNSSRMKGGDLYELEQMERMLNS